MKNIKIFFLSLMLIGNANAGFFEDEKVSIMKCMKSAKYLDDKKLAVASKYFANNLLEDKSSSEKEIMEINQQLLDESEPAGASTNPQYTLNVANSWKESSFCENVITEFDNHIDSSIQQVLSSKTYDANDDKSCSNYAKKYDYVIYASEKSVNRNPAIESIMQDMIDAAEKLNPEQKEIVRKISLVGDENFLMEIRNNCEKEKSLISSIIKSEIIKNYKSTTTIALEGKLNEFENVKYSGIDRCEIGMHYCEIAVKISSAKSALDASRSCDSHPVGCQISADELLNKYYKEEKVSGLISASDSLKASNIDESIPMDKCVDEASKRPWPYAGLASSRGNVRCKIISNHKIIVILSSEKLNYFFEALSTEKSIKTSKETDDLRNILHVINSSHDCGSQPDSFCDSEFKADLAKIALAKSLNCDIYKHRGSSCAFDLENKTVEKYIESQLSQLKKSILLAEKDVYEAMSARRGNDIDPEKFQEIVTECVKRKRSDGVLNELELNEFRSSVCDPQAEQAVISPYLATVQALVVEINKL